jgi:divalent metal cation (Fe/Co/Zn/Cd) transporter
VIKGFCWFWCRLVKNSSVQALAQDAMTDCVFNTFSIIFPLVGFYAQIWWADALGGLLLSLYVIYNWSLTSSTHVRNLVSSLPMQFLLTLTAKFLLLLETLAAALHIDYNLCR